VLPSQNIEEGTVKKNRLPVSLVNTLGRSSSTHTRHNVFIPVSVAAMFCSEQEIYPEHAEQEEGERKGATGVTDESAFILGSIRNLRLRGHNAEEITFRAGNTAFNHPAAVVNIKRSVPKVAHLPAYLHGDKSRVFLFCVCVCVNCSHSLDDISDKLDPHKSPAITR